MGEYEAYSLCRRQRGGYAFGRGCCYWRSWDAVVAVSKSNIGRGVDPAGLAHVFLASGRVHSWALPLHLRSHYYAISLHRHSRFHVFQYFELLMVRLSQIMNACVTSPGGRSFTIEALGALYS